MPEPWERHTTIVPPGSAPPEVVAAIERTALGLGIEWSADAVTLAWSTTSTTTAGRLRKRTRTVQSVGFLGPEVLAWTVAEDGAAPGAVVVRRSRIDIADGATATAGLPPEMTERFTSAGADGVTVRGDLGGRDIGNVFIGLGSGPDADTVRAALLGTG